MKILFKYLKLVLSAEKKWLAIGLLLSVFTAFAVIALLSLSGWFIAASAVAGLSAATLYTFNYMLPATGVRFFALTRIVSRYGERVISHDTTFKILAKLRVSLYAKIEPLAPAYLLRYRSGDLVSRMVTDIDTLDNLYLKIVTPLFVSGIISLLLIFYLHFFSSQIAWLVTGGLFIAVILLPVFAYSQGRKPGYGLTLTQANIRQEIILACQYLPELLAYQQWQNKIDKIYKLQNLWMRYQRQLVIGKANTQVVIQLVTGAVIIMALIIGIQLVQQNMLQGANLALIILTILISFETVAVLPIAWQYLQHTVSAAKRLDEINYTKPSAIFSNHQNLELRHFDIHIDNISFGYQQQPSIENFSLAIPAKKHLYITGTTGCGKTTIARLLNRFYDVDQGNITIGGNDIKNFNESQLRQTVRYVEQRPHLFNASIRENLLIADSKATEKQMLLALAAVDLAELINQLPDGLDTWVNEAGSRFSGGQIRRLTLARALINPCPITIFDEPSEGLDKKTAKMTLQNIHNLFHDKTVIIITHQPELIEDQHLTVNI